MLVQSYSQSVVTLFSPLGTATPIEIISSSLGAVNSSQDWLPSIIITKCRYQSLVLGILVLSATINKIMRSRLYWQSIVS